VESSTFRDWLTQNGCRIDSHAQNGRAHGHGMIVVHRGQLKAEVPLLGKHQQLDPGIIREVCTALRLDPSSLPGPRSRV
jgi:hypothetical protein